MSGRLILFMLGFIVWMGLNWPPDLHDVIFGVLVAGIVAAITGDLFARAPHGLKKAGRYIWFLYYIPLFIWECLKANIDVAYRVVHPIVPIRPGIVRVRTKLRSDTGLTFLANSITLTPGTMCVDIDRDNGFIYIHWINVQGEEIENYTKHLVEKFENILGRIFE